MSVLFSHPPRHLIHMRRSSTVSRFACGRVSHTCGRTVLEDSSTHNGLMMTTVIAEWVT